MARIKTSQSGGSEHATSFKIKLSASNPTTHISPARFVTDPQFQTLLLRLPARTTIHRPLLHHSRPALRHIIVAQPLFCCLVT